MARIRASVDAAEAERVSERTRRAKLQRARQGQPMTGGGQPFGYPTDRLTRHRGRGGCDPGRREPGLGGESLVSIVAEWNRAGAPVPGTGGCGRVARKYQPPDEWVISEWAHPMTELTGSESWSREENPGSPDDTAVAAEEEVTRRIATLRDWWAAGVIGDEDSFPLIEKLQARLAEMDNGRGLH